MKSEKGQDFKVMHCSKTLSDSGVVLGITL